MNVNLNFGNSWHLGLICLHAISCPHASMYESMDFILLKKLLCPLLMSHNVRRRTFNVLTNVIPFVSTSGVFFRLLQGVAVGGELVGCFIYTIEATNNVNRGFWGGLCKASGNFGAAIGIGTCVFMRFVFNEHLQETLFLLMFEGYLKETYNFDIFLMEI